MLLGLAGELVGYAGRLSLHDDPFSSNAFLQYLVSLTIAPAFLSAAIYLCLSRIVVAYGERISYFRPRTYTMVFIAFDFIALLLQAIGGGIAASTDGSNAKTVHLGKNIMIGGLAWQVASLLIFAGMSGYFVLRVRRASPTDFNYDFERVRHSRYFKLGMWGLGIATLAIFVRSVFRCAELSEGFDGTLANDEVTFMILEGAMICIAVICQTVFHPGAIFKGQWHDAVWHTRASKETTNYPKATSSDSSTYSPSNPAYDRYAQA
ncbi:hypothetical protein AOCH_004197 [Aspergillus ochraceoroseus]|nr:hypothetical protein AOCH_004197 [Aspergillus ochraceoroseus]